MSGQIRLVAASVAAIALSSCGSQTAYRVPSEAMLPTVKVGQIVNVDKGAYGSRSPAVGDIVILHPPIGAQTAQCGAPQPAGAACARPTPVEWTAVSFIKRIVAGPQDRIALRAGRSVRNGVLQAEPFALPCAPVAQCDFPRAITVPPGEWFVLGDNRGASDDSRFWGPVPQAWIFGKVSA